MTTAVCGSMQLMYVFPTSEHEEIWAYLDTYRGKSLAYLRIYRSDGDGVWERTRNHVAVDLVHLNELRDAVDALIGAAEERV